MTLADSLGAVAAFLHLPEGASTATVSSNTVLMRPASKGRVTGTATVINARRRFITVQTELADEAGKPISSPAQVQAVIATSREPSHARSKRQRKPVDQLEGG